MTWQEWLAQAVPRLRSSLSPSARRDAEILLAQVTGAARTRLLAFSETPSRTRSTLRLRQR